MGVIVNNEQILSGIVQRVAMVHQLVLWDNEVMSECGTVPPVLAAAAPATSLARSHLPHSLPFTLTLFVWQRAKQIVTSQYKQ